MPIREACHVALQRNRPGKQRLWKHTQARQQAKGQVATPVLQIVRVLDGVFSCGHYELLLSATSISPAEDFSVWSCWDFLNFCVFRSRMDQRSAIAPLRLTWICLILWMEINQFLMKKQGSSLLRIQHRSESSLFCFDYFVDFSLLTMQWCNPGGQHMLLGQSWCWWQNLVCVLKIASACWCAFLRPFVRIYHFSATESLPASII